MFDCKSERKSIGKREREGRDKRRRERVERIHGGEVIENQSFILPVVTVESTVTRSFVFSRSKYPLVFCRIFGQGTMVNGGQ